MIAIVVCTTLALAGSNGTTTPTTPTSTTTTTAAPAAELFLMPVVVDDRALRPLGRALERRLGQALSAAGHKTMTSQDLAALFDLAAARQNMGCDDDDACAAELAGSIGAERVVTASLVQLDGRYRLDLTLSDREAARVLGRARATGRSADEVEADIDIAVGELFGQARASGPSPLVIGGAVGVGVGVVGAAVGGVLGWLALDARTTLERAGTAFDDAPGAATVADLATAHTADEQARQGWNLVGLPLVAVGSVAVVAGAGLIVAASLSE